MLNYKTVFCIHLIDMNTSFPYITNNLAVDFYIFCMPDNVLNHLHNLSNKFNLITHIIKTTYY